MDLVNSQRCIESKYSIALLPLLEAYSQNIAFVSRNLPYNRCQREHIALMHGNYPVRRASFICVHDIP